jgi:hypothetical protein
VSSRAGAVARASRMGLHRQGSGRQAGAKGSRLSPATVKGTIVISASDGFDDGGRQRRFCTCWRSQCLRWRTSQARRLPTSRRRPPSRRGRHTWEGMPNKTDPVSVTIAGGKVVGYTNRGFTRLPSQFASVSRSPVSLVIGAVYRVKLIKRGERAAFGPRPRPAGRPHGIARPAGARFIQCHHSMPQLPLETLPFWLRVVWSASSTRAR